MKKNVERLSRIQAAASQGKSSAQIAMDEGVSLVTVWNYAKKYGVNFGGDKNTGRPRTDRRRTDAIVSMFNSGATLEDIAMTFGISQSNAFRIIRTEQPLPKKEARVKRTRDQVHLERYGCTYEQYCSIPKSAEMADYYRSPIGAFNNQRSVARRRGITWSLTFWDWWQIWDSSGHWSNRGRGAGKHVMCRSEDTGAYEVGNVYIATSDHNISVQPNNPFRKDHPLHEEYLLTTYSHKRTRCRRSDAKHDLPLGVTPNGSSGRFSAKVMIAGKRIYLGSFATPELAHAAYLDALNLTDRSNHTNSFSRAAE